MQGMLSLMKFLQRFSILLSRNIMDLYKARSTSLIFPRSSSSIRIRIKNTSSLLEYGFARNMAQCTFGSHIELRERLLLEKTVVKALTGFM